jgi:hypothetical protein
MNTSLVQPASVRDEALAILSRLEAPESAFAREGIAASSPITGELITHVRITNPEEASAAIGEAVQAFNAWRTNELLHDLPSGSKGMPVPVLETGRGGITLCKVHIGRGPEYGILIEPCSEAELRRHVLDFSHVLLDDRACHRCSQGRRGRPLCLSRPAHIQQLEPHQHLDAWARACRRCRPLGKASRQQV